MKGGLGQRTWRVVAAGHERHKDGSVTHQKKITRTHQMVRNIFYDVVLINYLKMFSNTVVDENQSNKLNEILSQFSHNLPAEARKMISIFIVDK